MLLPTPFMDVHDGRERNAESLAADPGKPAAAEY